MICLFLFQLANASILPQVSQTLVHSEGHLSSPAVSALIVFPQICRTVSTLGGAHRCDVGTSTAPVARTCNGADTLGAFCVNG
jgi:hypothetical protein